MGLTAPFVSLAEMAGAVLPPLKLVPLWLIRLLSSRNAWDNRQAIAVLSESAHAPQVDILHASTIQWCPSSMGKGCSATSKLLASTVVLAAQAATTTTCSPPGVT